MTTPPPGVDLPLTASQVEIMLRAVLRHRELFSLAAVHVTPELFDQLSEGHCRVLWRVAMDYVKTFGVDSLFSADPAAVQSAMTVEAHARLSQSDADLARPLWASLLGTDRRQPGLAAWTFTYSTPADCHVPQARDYLGRFLSERAVQRPLRELLQSSDGRPFSDLPALLRSSIDRELSVRAVNVNPIQSIAPVGYRPPPIDQWATGVPFLDTMLDGGHAAGETYGVLGAYGSGKTMLAVQLACRGVSVELDKVDKAAARGERYEPKHAYLFHYEATTPEVVARGWSHICEIDWSRMMRFDPDTLSSSHGPVALLEYEKTRWRKQFQATGMVDGERERLTRLDRYRDLLHIVDMSCPPEDPKRGTGYVPEIAQILSTWAVGHRIGCVIVDYVGLCSTRFLNAQNMRQENLRHLIGGFADKVKYQVATPFQCPVWLMHQLAAAANKKSSAMRQHHSDAAEAKNWAENLHFSFQLGVPEESTRCLRLACSKARRAKIPNPVGIRIDGQFSALVDASDQYAWDDRQSRFVPMHEAAKWAEVVPTIDAVTGLPLSDATAAYQE